MAHGHVVSLQKEQRYFVLQKTHETCTNMVVQTARYGKSVVRTLTEISVVLRCLSQAPKKKLRNSASIMNRPLRCRCFTIHYSILTVREFSDSESFVN